jgi:hypothetical protein
MIFIDNKYTRIYYEIVNRAKTRVTAEKTEKHHIIPESFYLNRSRRGRTGWLDGNPNTLENLVYLTLHEHFVCHLLLTKMVQGTEAQHKVDAAAAWIANCYKGQNNGVHITGRIYVKLKLAAAQAQSARKRGQVAPIKGMTAWNNGIHVVMSLKSPGPNYVLGSLHVGSKKAHAKGTKWWNNGVTAVMKKECPGPGWVRGNLKSYDQMANCLGRKKWNNGIVEITAVECPGSDFVPGRLLKGKYPGNKTGLKAWTNGTIVKFATEQPGPDFVRGLKLK